MQLSVRVQDKVLTHWDHGGRVSSENGSQNGCGNEIWLRKMRVWECVAQGNGQQHRVNSLAASHGNRACASPHAA